VDELVEQPGISCCRAGQLTGNIEPARCQLKESLTPGGGRAGVIVDVAPYLPAEHIKAEVVEVFESIVDRVTSLAETSLGLNGGNPGGGCHGSGRAWIPRRGDQRDDVRHRRRI